MYADSHASMRELLGNGVAIIANMRSCEKKITVYLSNLVQNCGMHLHPAKFLNSIITNNLSNIKLGNSTVIPFKISLTYFFIKTLAEGI